MQALEVKLKHCYTF